MKISIFLVLVVLATSSIISIDLARGAEMEAGAGKAKPLTISGAVLIALRKNPTVQAAREKLNELNSATSLAFSSLFPTISSSFSLLEKKDAVLNNANALYGGNPYNSYNFGLSLSQPIYSGGALAGALSGAKVQKNIGELNDVIVERTLTLNVILAFYNVILSKRNLDTLKNNRAIVEDLMKTTKGRHRIGRSQLLDVLQSETQVALVDPQISQARNQIEVSATQLASYLDEREAGSIEITGNLEPLEWINVEAVLKTLKSSIPEIDQAEKQLELVDNTGEVTLAKHWPQVSAVGNWGRATNVRTDLLSDNATAWSVGLQLTIPIFSGLSSFQERKVIASQKAQQDFNVVNIKDQMFLSQIQAKKNFDYAKDNLVITKIAFDLAQKSLVEAQKDYRLATIDYLQYLATSQSMLVAQVSYDQAKYAYLSNLAQYFSAWGYPLKELVALLEANKVRQ